MDPEDEMVEECVWASIEGYGSQMGWTAYEDTVDRDYDHSGSVVRTMVEPQRLLQHGDHEMIVR